MLTLLAAIACFSVVVAASAQTRSHEIVPEDYFTLQSAGSPVFSPDGQYVAWVQSGWEGPGGGRRSDLWVMRANGEQQLRLTFDIARPHGIAWGAESEWIYFGGRWDRGEEKPPYDGTHQVWRIRRGATDLQAVSRVDDGIDLFELSRDGQLLYYTVGSEHYDEEWKKLRKKWSDLEYGHGVVEYSEVRRLDLRTWRDEQVLEGDRVIHLMTLAPQGDRLALQTSPDEEIIFNEGWSNIEVLDIESGELGVVTAPDWREDHPAQFGWLTEMAWSQDGRALAFDVAFDGYPTQIWVAEWQDGAPQLQQIERPGDVSYSGGLSWRGDTRALLYLGEERARQEIYQVSSVENGQQGNTSGFIGMDVVMTSYAFDDQGRRAIVAADYLDRVGELYNLEKGILRRLTSVNGHMEEWILPQIQDFTWTGADGDEVHGILELPADYDPASGERLPTIIELHGGPTSSTKHRFRLWIYGRALMAAKGYALLSPNYHGSTGFGDEFLTKLIGRENEIEVTDIANGTEALIEAGIADRDRIGVMGWSNGGYLTNCMIVARPDLYKAASSGAGVLDMVIQWGIEDTPGHVINFVEGLPWEQAEEYQRASPLFGLDRVTTPTLIHVGGNDPRVPPAHSRALYRALYHYLDVPVELVVYPNEPHGLSTYDNRLAKMQWDLAWFDKYLLGMDDESAQTKSD
jgi:dipeptidyl aminopeptidase/acylaminoacyl peptidase